MNSTRKAYYLLPVRRKRSCFMSETNIMRGLMEDELPVDDAERVKAAQQDPAAFSALYHSYVTPVYRYLYSRTGNVAEAEDLTTLVFISALENLQRYQEQGNFKAWLFTLARNKLTDSYRHERWHLPLEEWASAFGSNGNNPEQVVLKMETMDQLRGLFVELKPEQQELLHLRFAAQLSFAQIAQVVGRSEAAVKMAVYRILQRLNAAWEVD
jgi:RNA polymerase sigma-70 factor, ECF subfamily